MKINETQAMIITGMICDIAEESLQKLDALLKKNADYESKMNFFMGFLAQLIEAREKTL